jgi:integrase/recombinase XerD
LPCGGELADVAAADVIGAVLRESAAVSVSATQFFVAGLRSFLRFCFIEGLVEADLSQAALPATGRRRSSLPRGITEPDANALLACCDRRSAVGRRDYALITTVLRLGLRASEVAGLRLDDIDWRAGELVVRGKGARSDRLPLPADVGWSIASYLQRGRPRSKRREVFLRARAPFGPIAPAHRLLDGAPGVPTGGGGGGRCSPPAPHGGLRNGLCRRPLVQIAQVLRHHSLQSTAIYARVDVELRLLAAPWPEGAQR